MPRLLTSLAVSLTLLATTATAALADVRPGGPVGPTAVAFKRPAPQTDNVLGIQRAGMRSGSMTFDLDRGATRGDLQLISTDSRVAIRRVMIQYAGGRKAVVRGNRDGSLDLPDGGRITSVTVMYANKGARGAMIKLVAKSVRPQHDGWHGRR
jgi:hypothetical protein